MEWRSGIHVSVLLTIVCAMVSPGNCVRRVDSPLLLEDADRDVKDYLPAKTANISGSTSSAEFVAQRSGSLGYGQFWSDLLNAMKWIEEEDDVDVTSGRLRTLGMPLYADSSKASVPSDAHFEPLVAVDGNKSGLLLLVKEGGGRHVIDDTSVFPGDGRQREEPDLLQVADPDLNSAVDFDSDDLQATNNSSSQLEQAAADAEPLDDETTTTLTSRVSETVTSPTPDFAEKFTAGAHHTPNVTMSLVLENKQLTLKRSNRVARVKRSDVVQDASSNVWRAVYKPMEAYQVRQVNSDFGNPLTPISELKRPSENAVQRNDEIADEPALIRAPPNDGSVAYSLFHSLGPQVGLPGNVVHHTTATKGVGGSFYPEKEAKQMLLGENRQYQQNSMDNSRGEQTYLDQQFLPVRSTNTHHTTAVGAKDERHTLEDQFHLHDSTEEDASSRFVLKIQNTKDEHLYYAKDQGTGPINVVVSNVTPSTEDLENPTRFNRTGQQLVSYDDDDLDSGASKVGSLSAETEGLQYRRSARGIWTPSLRSAQKSDIRRHDDELERGEQPSGVRQEPADVFDNEVEEDNLKTAADGSGVQKSVLEALLDRLERCLRSLAVSALDGLQRADVATVWPGVELVRVGADRIQQRTRGKAHAGDSTLDKDEDDRWAATAVDKLADLLRTHAIRLRLSPPADDEREEGRRIRYRHQYKHMFPLVVMGYMIMSSFLVPLGFQLMAVLSGKALLLSKMALAVAGMAGFKRLFLAGIGPEYAPPPPPAVLHHETYPVYHEHHASFVK